MDTNTIYGASGEVRQPRSGEARYGTAALVESHGDYPAFVALCPDRGRRQAMLRPLFATMTVGDGIRHAEVWAEVADDVVRGEAV